SRRHFEWVAAHPERFLALARASRADPEVVKLVVSGRQDALAEILEVDGAPPRLRAALCGWSGYVHEITLHWLANRDDMDVDELAEMCLNVLVRSAPGEGDNRAEIDAALLRLGSRTYAN
ncbi:MAG: hypothetical protein QOF98_179, partial [Streptomyces sp.]|nr:hypothetical protein [Streptomyces sp.]